MRRFLLLHLVLGAVGLVWTSNGSLAQEIVVNAQAASAAASGTASALCVATQKVCVPKPDTKKITKVVYGCKDADFCYSKSGVACCNQGCDAGCESCVRTKRVLLKKTVTVAECPTTKCVVEERAAEACPATCVDRCRPGCRARQGDACETVVPITPGQKMPPANRTTAAPARATPAAVEAQPLPPGDPR